MLSGLPIPNSAGGQLLTPCFSSPFISLLAVRFARCQLLTPSKLGFERARMIAINGAALHQALQRGLTIIDYRLVSYLLCITYEMTNDRGATIEGTISS